MTGHYPYVTLELDNPDLDPLPEMAREIAESAWEFIRNWTNYGYSPVITVHLSPTESVDIDLEEAP